MKRGAVAILAVLVFLLIVSSYIMFYQLNKAPTGQVVNLPENNTQENVTIPMDLDSIKDNCDIPFPFECKIWAFNPDNNEIILQITNLASYDYIIKSLNIQDCSTTNLPLTLRRKTARPMKFTCPFESNSIFQRSISFTYKEPNQGLDIDSEGSIIKKID